MACLLERLHGQFHSTLECHTSVMDNNALPWSIHSRVRLPSSQGPKFRHPKQDL